VLGGATVLWMRGRCLGSVGAAFEQIEKGSFAFKASGRNFVVTSLARSRYAARALYEDQTGAR
jgi:hypothetical protein